MGARFGYVPFVSPFHDEQASERMLRPYLARFDDWGGKQQSAGSALDGLRVGFIGTGGTERQVLDWWAAAVQAGHEQSVLLVAHPDHNSLAAALEVTARLQQQGAASCIVYMAGPDDPHAEGRLREALHDVAVEAHLRSTRIGVIGAPSDWLVASSPDADVVRRIWGPTLCEIPTATLQSALQKVESAELDARADAFIRNAVRVGEPAIGAVRDAVGVFLALRHLVDKEGLKALTVRCFDLVTTERTTACYALSRLNDEGTIAGCEGDVVSTLGLLWVHTLLGVLPWMANVARVDEAEHTMLLAHCTVPTAMVRGYSIRSHFESGLGVGIEGAFATGPVTLLRIGGENLDKLWVTEGELVDTGQDPNLCRTQILVRVAAGVVEQLLRSPLGNHLVVLPGHHQQRLESWWQFAIKPRVNAATSRAKKG